MSSLLKVHGEDCAGVVPAQRDSVSRGVACAVAKGWILTPEHAPHGSCDSLFKLAFPVFSAPNHGGGTCGQKPPTIESCGVTLIFRDA